MGLEIVEIFMDIEEEFCIKIPTDTVFTGRVGEIIDLVNNLYSKQYIEKLMTLIPKDGPNGYIDFQQYEEVQKCHSSLPLPYNILKMRHNYKQNQIVGMLQEKLKYSDSNVMRDKIYAIIKERSGFAGQVTSDHHLVNDLNCG